MSRAGIVLAQRHAGQRPTVGDLGDLDATEMGPSTRGWLQYAHGEMLGDREPDQAFAVYDQALTLALAGGNRLLEGVALVSSCALRARAGDSSEAALAFGTAIRHWQRLAATTHQLTTLRNLPTLLRRIDKAELAAELIGVVDHDVFPTYGVEADRLEEVRQWALGRLGAERFEDCARRGRLRDRSTVEEWVLTELAYERC